MKIEFIKCAGGTLVPVNDMEAEKLTRFKTGEQFPVEIKNPRNPAFHRKVFAFFNFCFDHWSCGNEFLSPAKQFDVFRQELTVFAGFYDTYGTISGGYRIEAKSLSFASMSQDEFEECYQALIQAAMTHIFSGNDQQIYEKLSGFF